MLRGVFLQYFDTVGWVFDLTVFVETLNTAQSITV